MEFSIIGLTPPPPPYFQPKSKCVLNDSEWLETHFKQVFMEFDISDPLPQIMEFSIFFF